jgi:hypothetical protein
MHMLYKHSYNGKEPPTVYEAPGALALLAGQTVKDRIWVFLYESLNRDIQEGGKEISIFNEVDFYNVCKGDLIKSKRDKYKPIKAALKKLTEEGDVVKINIKGEPWKSRDEEPWYHFRTSRTKQGLPDDYLSGQYKKMLEQDKLIIKLYNRSFHTNFTPEQYHTPHNRPQNVFDKQGSHFLDFVYAMHELIEIFNRPDIGLPFEERLDRGMMWPKVSLTYLPGSSYWEEISKLAIEEFLKNQRDLISEH